MRKIILYYLYLLLSLEALNGFLLSYLNLSDKLPINPGELTRSILLVLLIAWFIKKITFKVPRYYLLLIVLIISLFATILYQTFSHGLTATISEASSTSKVILTFLIAFYVSVNRVYFSIRLEKIVAINFLILSLNLLLGHFTDYGLTTYERTGVGTKGFLDGGNVASIFSLLFFSYYLFKMKEGYRYIFFVLVAFFNVYAVGTKVIFAVPILIVLYTFTEIKNKKTKIIIGIAIITLMFTFLASAKVIELYNNRYKDGLQSANIDFTQNITLSDNIAEYRRFFYAFSQLSNQVNKPKELILGYGNYGQERYWINNGSPKYTFAAMDLFDFLFRYGILITFVLILYVYRCIKLNYILKYKIMLVLILSYSFFGGYVLFLAGPGSFLGLLLGTSLGNRL